MWTLFWDMHSGGGCKEKPFEKIYVESPEAEARTIFYNRFGHNPNRVTCTCCGEDYSIYESETLEQATAFHRNCAYDKKADNYIDKPDPERPDRYMPLADYLAQANVLVVRSSEIKDAERAGDVPEQGYVWR